MQLASCAGSLQEWPFITFVNNQSKKKVENHSERFSLEANLINLRKSARTKANCATSDGAG